MGDAARLLLIDGHAAAYRFFFGVKHLSTSDGTPINALFGFIRMVQLMRRKWQPTHLAAVFDGGLPESRLALVPDYKAHRKPMPDELREQLPIIEEYLKSAGICHVCLDGQEADDVLATLAAEASRDGADVKIATGDKDMFQIVNERIHMVTLAGEPVELDAAGIEMKTGVRPDQIVDWLALIGDAADNIRGVPGVGPKTATKLLVEFQNLDRLYAHLDSIDRRKLRLSLETARPLVMRNREMVKLDLSVAGVLSWTDLSCVAEPVSTLMEFYSRYDLKAFAKALREPELF